MARNAVNDRLISPSERERKSGLLWRVEGDDMVVDETKKIGRDGVRKVERRGGEANGASVYTYVWDTSDGRIKTGANLSIEVR